MKNSKKGISLIVLIVAIVVVVMIVAGVVFSFMSKEEKSNSNNNGTNNSIFDDEKTQKDEKIEDEKNDDKNVITKFSYEESKGYKKEIVKDLIGEYITFDETSFDKPAPIGTWVEATAKDKLDDARWEALYVRVDKVTNYNDDMKYVEKCINDNETYGSKGRFYNYAKLNETLYIVDYSVYVPSHFKTGISSLSWCLSNKHYSDVSYNLKTGEKIIGENSEISYIEASQLIDVNQIAFKGNEDSYIEPGLGKILKKRCAFNVYDYNKDLTKDELRIRLECFADGKSITNSDGKTIFADTFAFFAIK